MEETAEIPPIARKHSTQDHYFAALHIRLPLAPDGKDSNEVAAALEGLPSHHYIPSSQRLSSHTARSGGNCLLLTSLFGLCTY